MRKLFFEISFNALLLARGYRAAVFLALCSALVAPRFPAQAQQPAGIPRIGLLIGSSASVYATRVEAFRRRLRELGYVEGKNIVIEYRYAKGKRERLSELAAELVRLKVDVIVTSGPGILAAKKASPTMPIVFGSASDPVELGLSPAWRNQAGISPVLVTWRRI